MARSVLQVCFPEPFESLFEKLDLLPPFAGTGPVRCDRIVQRVFHSDHVKSRVQHLLNEIASRPEAEPPLRINDRQHTGDRVPQGRNWHHGELLDCEATCPFGNNSVFRCPHTDTDARCSRAHPGEGGDRDQSADHPSWPNGHERAGDDGCTCYPCRCRDCESYSCQRQEKDSACYEHRSPGESRFLYGVLTSFDPVPDCFGELCVADLSMSFPNSIECVEQSDISLLVADLDVERVKRRRHLKADSKGKQCLVGPSVAHKVGRVVQEVTLVRESALPDGGVVQP